MIPHVPLNRRKGLEKKLVGVELSQPLPLDCLKALLHFSILLDDSLGKGEKKLP